MGPKGEGRSLHMLLAAALERAAEAQEHSHAIRERQRALTEAVNETMGRIEERRGEARRTSRTYGNGHPGARERSTPG